MFRMHLSRKVKELDHLDLIFIKLGAIFLAFFFLLAMPIFMNWLNRQNPWWMLGLAAIFLARPIYKRYLK